jgi:hypothetical protein
LAFTLIKIWTDWHFSPLKFPKAYFAESVFDAKVDQDRVVHKSWRQPDAEDSGMSRRGSKKYSDTTLIFFK